MNVTVHAVETSTEKLLDQHLPDLLRPAGDVSVDWALWQSKPHVIVSERRHPGDPLGETRPPGYSSARRIEAAPAMARIFPSALARGRYFIPQ